MERRKALTERFKAAAERRKADADAEQWPEPLLRGLILQAASECASLSDAQSRIWRETGVFADKRFIRNVVREAAEERAAAAGLSPHARYPPGQTPLGRGIPRRWA